MSARADPSPNRPKRPRRSPWQFGLRGMALGFAGAGLLFVVMRELGTVWSMAMLWFLVLVAGHVFANAWGSAVPKSLRRTSGDCEDDSRPARHLARSTPAPQWTPTLRQHVSHGRLDYYLCGLAALAGTGAGGTLLAHQYWDRLSNAALALGAVSFGVMAGLFGFLLGTFFRVVMQAWRDARRVPPTVATRRATR